MNRHDTDTLKIEAEGFNTVYMHCQYKDGKPYGFRISSPGKYSDAALGNLLDAIGDAATRLVRSST